jgi:hypothetical protein
VQGVATAGAGFLLAVLWFDLMFDVQVLRPGPEPADASDASNAANAAVASIAAYYRRVTTAARPMNRLVATGMLATIVGVVAEVVRGSGPAWVSAVSLALVVGSVGLAGTRTVPHAVRLGTQQDPPARQRELARSILRDHLVCLAAISALLALQLSTAL